LKEEILENEKSREELRGICDDILASKSIIIERRFGQGGLKTKSIDVKRFVKDIRLTDDAIFVECNVSGQGTIRVEEILELLRIRLEQLKDSVRRVKVQWQQNN
jgi:hypothetical protein